MKRRDIIILALVLIASLTLYLLRPKSFDNTSSAAFLRVTIAGETQELIPLTDDRVIRITQDNGDYNVIHIMNGGFEVIESNCYNQNCIHQGKVTVDNISSRVLANEIICLPHQLVLSLVTEDDSPQESAP